nr:Cell division protein FtsL [Kibdelosporangium sp. MJ126-NF4]
MMLVMGLLVTGVIVTLWLSTQAIADSYRLEKAKKAATELAEQVEVLQREVTNLGSPAMLDELARKQGMIPPSGDPAWLVVRPDGKVTVVGEPKPAAPPAPPSTPAPTSETPPPSSAADTPGGNG